MATAHPNLIVNGKLDQQAVAAELRLCLDTLLRKGRFELVYEIRTVQPAGSTALENPEVVVIFRGRDQDLLLERNAELLKALEYVSLRWLRLEPQFYGRVQFDAREYHTMRIEELKLSARVAAGRVRETQTPFRFNPMAARERRILHLVLQEESGVRSASEGTGVDRRVVVYPGENATSSR